MASKHKKKTIVISETKLRVQCMEILIKNKWEIAAIVSDANSVITWTENNSLPTVPTTKPTETKNKDFYLFSIINPNFFLSKYAWINTTRYLEPHRFFN